MDIGINYIAFEFWLSFKRKNKSVLYGEILWSVIVAVLNWTNFGM